MLLVYSQHKDVIASMVLLIVVLHIPNLTELNQLALRL